MAGKQAVPYSTDPQNYEEILEKLGGFGKFQGLMVVLILFFEIPAAFLMFVHIFTGISTDDWDCDGFLVNSTEACNCNGTLSAPSTSFVAEWQLICGSAWVSDFITSIQMAGMFLGNLYAGQASDWYGRRYTTLGSVLFICLGSSASALAPNPYIYAVARLICGAAFSAYLSTSTVYIVEFLPPKWRPMGGSCGPYGEATMGLALIAYFVRPWRTLTWMTTVPCYLLFLVFPLIPESPRWYLQRGKTEDLDRVLKYMSRVNGHPAIEMAVLEKIVAKECPLLETTGPLTNEPRPTFAVFFKKEYRLKAICLCIIFFSWSVIFFGISFNIKNMEGDLYWNVFYLGLTDAIGFPSALLILNRFGRRISLILSSSMAALFLVILAILHLATEASQFPTLLVVLALCGKFGISVARSCIRALSTEAFPTAIRSMGSSLCGISSAIGGVISAQLAFLGSTSPAIPFFTFAVIGVTGSLCALLMPETTGKPLEESMQRKRNLSIVSKISNLVFKPIKETGTGMT